MWVGSNGTIQADAAVKGYAGGEADQQEGVAVGQRQVRHAFGVHYRAQRSGFGIEQGGFRAHRHRLFGGADFQGEADVEAVRDADFDGCEWIS